MVFAMGFDPEKSPMDTGCYPIGLNVQTRLRKFHFCWLAGWINWERMALQSSSLEEAILSWVLLMSHYLPCRRMTYAMLCVMKWTSMLPSPRMTCHGGIGFSGRTIHCWIYGCITCVDLNGEIGRRQLPACSRGSTCFFPRLPLSILCLTGHLWCLQVCPEWRLRLFRGMKKAVSGSPSIKEQMTCSGPCQHPLKRQA